MKISAKTNYVCRAILELSLHWPSDKPLGVTKISKRQKIPLKFLTQIFIHLKLLGYVVSTRGRHGGYRLAKAPVEINLYDLILSLEPKHLKNKELERGSDIFGDIWEDIRNTLSCKLREYNFEMISQSYRAKNLVVNFSI